MLIGHRNDKIVKVVEERSKDSDTSCKPTSHTNSHAERCMLLVGMSGTVQGATTWSDLQFSHLLLLTGSPISL